MTFRLFLFVVLLGTCFAGGAFWIVGSLVDDPVAAGPLVVAAFLSSLALCGIGVCTLIGVLVHRLFARDAAVLSRVVATAFRQACLIVMVLMVCLLLSHAGLLSWWTGTVLLLGAMVFEYWAALPSNGQNV